jgi:hypothetical protein
MFLWNELLPGIFGLPVINYLQAIGLFLLTRILFSGIGHGAHHHFGHKNLLQKKWLSMSKAEQEAFAKRHGHKIDDLNNIVQGMGGNDNIKVEEKKEE